MRHKSQDHGDAIKREKEFMGADTPSSRTLRFWMLAHCYSTLPKAVLAKETSDFGLMFCDLRQNPFLRPTRGMTSAVHTHLHPQLRRQESTQGLTPCGNFRNTSDISGGLGRAWEGLGDFEIYSSLQCSMIILCRFIKQNFGTAILVIPKWAGHQAIVVM